MPPILQVAIGGALGATLRYSLSMAAARAFGTAFPWGTLAANVLGSFLMGVAIAWAAARAPQAWAMPFVTIGVLGGFTTFSSFSLEVVGLWEQGRMAASLGYVALSLFAAIGALVLGLALTRGALG